MFLQKADDYLLKSQKQTLTFHLTALERLNTVEKVTASSVKPHHVVALVAAAPAFIVERT